MNKRTPLNHKNNEKYLSDSVMYHGFTLTCRRCNTTLHDDTSIGLGHKAHKLEWYSPITGIVLCTLCRHA